MHESRRAPARALAAALLLAPLLLPLLAPPAAAWAWWTEDWEQTPTDWTFNGAYVSRDCTFRYAGACSLKMAPPCVTGTLVNTATTTVGDRNGNDAAFSFHFLTQSVSGHTDVWLDFQLANHQSADAGSLRVHLTNNGGSYNSGIQIVSEGHGASNTLYLTQANRWWIMSVRIEPLDDTAWLDVVDPSTGNVVGSTSKVGTAWSVQATSVTLSAQTVASTTGCAAHAFWFDNLRYGDTLPDEPWFPSATATRGRVDLSWSAPDAGVGKIQHYRVYRSTDGWGTEEIGTTTGTTYADVGLDEGRTYTYQIRAHNGYGDGPLSAAATAVTWNFGEDWENGTAGWGVTGASAQPDCASGVAGCSLRLQPAAGGNVDVSHQMNQVMTSRFQASFRYNATPGASAMDARFTVALDGPTYWDSSVVLHLTEGASGLGLRLDGLDGSSVVPYEPAAGAWTKVAVIVETASDVAWVEVRGEADEVLAKSGTVRVGASVTKINALAFAASTVGGSPGVVLVDDLVTGYLPGAPTALDGAGGWRQVRLTWAAPTEIGSGALTGYRVYRAAPGEAPQPVATLGLVNELTDVGLADDVAYEYAVAALTTAGEGPASAAERIRTDRFFDNFEESLDAWTVSDAASVARDCASAGRASACGLRVNPAARGVEVAVSHAMDSPLEGPVTASAWLRADRTGAATDATFRLSLSNGKSLDVDFLWTGASPSNKWRFEVQDYGWTTGMPAWTTAGAWYQAVISFDPIKEEAKGELRTADGRIVGSTTRFLLPGSWWSGGNVTGAHVLVKHATSGETATVHVDDVRVFNALMTPPAAIYSKLDRAILMSMPNYPVQENVLTGWRVYVAPAGSPMQRVADLPASQWWYKVTTLADGTRLENGRSYCVTVTALSAFVESASATHACVTPQAVADAPTDLRATSGVNEASLSWTEPIYDGDPAATQYCIFRGTSSTSRAELACVPYGQRTYTDETAVGGLTYYYSVRARNAAGDSADSNVAWAKPRLI